jgi:hypothetical protein
MRVPKTLREVADGTKDVGISSTGSVKDDGRLGIVTFQDRLDRSLSAARIDLFTTSPS